MAATKDQERKALEQIKKIVEDLGEDSYIAIAFDGVWELAEENIERDFGCSCRWYVDNFHETHDAYTKLVDDHDKQVTELEAELVRKESIISEQEIHFQELEKTYEAANEVKFDRGIEISNLKDKLGFANREIVKLKAKLYDYMTSDD